MQGIKRMGVALAAVLSLAVVGTATASAKAPKLDLTFNGQPVLPGQLLMLTSFEVTLASPSGSVRCGWVEPILGGIETNNAKTDKIRLVPSLGAHTFLFSHVCLASTGLGSAASVYVAGPVSDVESLNVKSNGNAELTSNSKEPLVVDVDYEVTGIGCQYTSPKLKGTVTLGSVKAMEIFLSQKLKLDKHASSAPCPKTATFTSSLVAHDNGYFVDDHVEP